MKVTAGGNTRCVQCGRTIQKGTECYEVPKGKSKVGAVLSFFGGGDFQAFCSEGCLNTYKGASSGGSGFSSVGSGYSGGGKTKIVHKEGMKASTKDLIVKTVIVFFVLLCIFAIIYYRSESNGEEKALQELAATVAEGKTYTVNKSSVQFKGALSEYLEAYDDVTAITEARDLESTITITLPLHCKKSVKDIDEFSSFYSSEGRFLVSVPSGSDLAGTIYSMMPGDKKILKIKLKTKTPGEYQCTESIESYQSLIECFELENLVFAGWTKKGEL